MLVLALSMILTCSFCLSACNSATLCWEKQTDLVEVTHDEAVQHAVLLGQQTLEQLSEKDASVFFFRLSSKALCHSNSADYGSANVSPAFKNI